MLPWHQYLLGLIFIIGGFNQFRIPKYYEKLVPPFFLSRSTIVLVSAIFEMALGMLLLNKETQTTAAWGLLILLVIVLIVFARLIKNKTEDLLVSKWFLVLLIPIVGFLIYWVTYYL